MRLKAYEASVLRRPGVRHGFFTRQGGVSEGLYRSLQCGRGTQADLPEGVAENRRRVLLALGAAGARLITLYQVHSARAVRVDGTGPEAAVEADGLVTDEPGLALGVLTADCAPVLFCDPGAGVIGAAHAGWKGALEGVLEATLGQMEALGATAMNICAAIGPMIQQSAYQVDTAYRARFLDHDPANARFFGPDADASRYRFDLSGYCAARLERSGLARVQRLSQCTCTQEAEFFSNRRRHHRGEADYGRGISVIMVS